MLEIRSRWKWGLAVLVASFFGGFLLVKISSGRPLVYQGESVQYWFEVLRNEVPTERHKAEAAFDAFGADSLDFLLSKATADVPTLTERTRVWFDKNIRHSVQIPMCGLGTVSEAALRHESLAKAFGVLGDRAKPVTKKLGRCLTNPTCRSEAAASLVAIGPSAWPEIQRGANSPDVEVRRAVVFALGDTKIEKINTCNILLQALKDSDGLVRHYAAHAVGELNVCPHQCIPALILALDDSDSRVRYISMFALQKFGSNAAPAISAIKRLRNDPEDSVRKSAMEIATNLEK